MIILIGREIGDSCMFACQRVPVIDIRMPLKAVISGQFKAVGQFI
jgi:hypothetical protein